MILKLVLRVNPKSMGYEDDESMQMDSAFGFDDSVILKGFEEIDVKAKVLDQVLMTDEEDGREYFD